VQTAYARKNAVPDIKKNFCNTVIFSKIHNFLKINKKDEVTKKTMIIKKEKYIQIEIYKELNLYEYPVQAKFKITDIKSRKETTVKIKGVKLTVFFFSSLCLFHRISYATKIKIKAAKGKLIAKNFNERPIQPNNTLNKLPPFAATEALKL